MNQNQQPIDLDGDIDVLVHVIINGSSIYLIPFAKTFHVASLVSFQPTADGKSIKFNVFNQSTDKIESYCISIDYVTDDILQKIIALKNACPVQTVMPDLPNVYTIEWFNDHGNDSCFAFIVQHLHQNILLHSQVIQVPWANYDLFVSMIKSALNPDESRKQQFIGCHPNVRNGCGDNMNLSVSPAPIGSTSKKFCSLSITTHYSDGYGTNKSYYLLTDENLTHFMTKAPKNQFNVKKDRTDLGQSDYYHDIDSGMNNNDDATDLAHKSKTKRDLTDLGSSDSSQKSQKMRNDDSCEE